MNIDNIVNKMSMIGKKILAYNDFGIIFINNGELICRKYTKDSYEDIDSFTSYKVTSYFIVLINRLGILYTYRIFIKDLDSDIALQLGFKAVDILFGESNKELINSKTKAQDFITCIIATSQLSKIAVINRKGKILSLDDYLPHYDISLDKVDITAITKNITQLELVYIEKECYSSDSDEYSIDSMTGTIKLKISNDLRNIQVISK